MISNDVASATRSWLPQQFGERRAAAVDDPLIEPLWTGPRVLILVDGSTVRVTDGDGDPVELPEEIRDQLVAAVRGARIVIEASLTPEPIQDLAAIAARDRIATPKPGEMAGQLIIGSRGGRKAQLIAEAEEARRRSTLPADDFAIVAVDLLWLDDDPLLDVPLLERRRILEAVLDESERIRRSIHVRPPVDAWLGSWRSFGFGSLAYKAANSRYRPGAANDDWAIARIPPR